MSALKNFGITFLISIIIFGIVAYFATGFVIGTFTNIIDGEDEKNKLGEIISNTDTNKPESGQTDVNPSTSDEKVPEGNSFDFLVVTSDYRPDLFYNYYPSKGIIDGTDWDTVTAADALGMLSAKYRYINLSSITLVRFDKENRQVLYTYISPYISVSTSSGERTLSEVYEYYGSSGLREHVKAITGIEADYMFFIDGYDFNALTETLGSVTEYVSMPVYQGEIYHTLNKDTVYVRTDENGETVTETKPNEIVLDTGNYSLDGESLYKLISVQENSTTSLTVKEAYSVEILQKYMATIGLMDKGRLKDALVTMTTPNEFGAVTLDTDFDVNNIGLYGGMLEAVTYFDSKIIKYPCTYRVDSENNRYCFDVDLRKALNVMNAFRIAPKA